MTDPKEENIIELTQPAIDKVAELMASRNTGPQAVRVLVHLGGPGGGQSEFTFVPLNDKKDDDTVLEMGPFPMYLDPQAVNALKGAKVDFDEARYSSGFHIEYENPLESYLSSRRKDWGDDPIANRVQAVVDQQVNPGVAGHGGWVVLLDVKDNTAFIEMGGGCRGCAISQMTLKQGIEKIITQEVPEIVQVLDTTDHSNGENPYYTEDPTGAAQTPF